MQILPLPNSSYIRKPCLPIHAVLVSVIAGGNPMLGLQYTLTCNVSVASGVTGTPTVQWVGPGSSAPIVTSGDFTVSSTSSYALTINPLRQSHGGQYTCQATVGDDTGTASVMVNIAGMYVSLTPRPSDPRQILSLALALLHGNGSVQVCHWIPYLANYQKFIF